MKKWRERKREGGKRREKRGREIWRYCGGTGNGRKGTAVNVGASDTHLCVRQVGREGRRERGEIVPATMTLISNAYGGCRALSLSLSGGGGRKRGILPAGLSLVTYAPSSVESRGKSRFPTQKRGRSETALGPRSRPTP